MKRKGRKSAAQTPAPPKERVYGSKKNPVGSAASKTSASSIVLSTSALKTLKDKKDKFNKENPSKKVGLPALKAVMRRGMGAYSKSHRPTITGGVPNSRQAWGFARVNKFLKKKSGEKVKAAYVQDDDLLEKGGELKLLAPNGKPSNLTPEQYRLVRTPEFKAWFGDWENDPKNASKVVDENGEPKVMYHGTLFDFNEFIPEDDFGFLIDRNIYFFTDDVNVAKGFASIKKRGKNKDKKVRIINAYINSRKPFDPEANKNEFDILYKITKYKNLADWMPNNWELLEDKKNVKKIKQLGYDSIITTETDSSVVFGKLSSSYKGKSLKNLGVFKSSQVKLADGTNTTFDPNNPDIRYEDGGFLQSIYEGMGNLIKNGIVLTDKSKSVSVIAYNTGNQERDKSLYNKALIYYSVKPLRQANEIIENFDNEEYSLFDVKKIEEYKNAPHLIILNQNEVVYDSNNPDIKYEDGGLIAPNGKKSNLTPEQYKLVRTPQFKAWFGDWENEPKNASKIVDENGEPLVVYHFSDIDFNIFELKGTSIGFFFVEDKYDDEFSAEGVIKSLDKGIIPRWLQKYSVSEEEIREGLKESKYKVSKPYFLSIKKLNKSVVPDVYWSTPSFENPRILKSKYDNYDGIEFINEVDEKRIIVAFEPYQIKLADGINTTFDPNNPDIRYKRGGEMKHEIALPDTYASYDRLKDILENQGYELQKKGKELPVGKLAKGMTLSEVAAIHGLKADDLKSELKLGIETEKEHTDIAEYARAIALDHLYEDPKYYTKLKKMEKSYKDGGEIAHISGKAGGVLVGRRHSEGGIKAVNKSNNQPLEMEGGEVVITRNAVSDSTKREFEGEMLTNREILSRINQSGGGVAFADGGEVEPKCACKGNKYKWGGKMVSDYDIVNQINNLYEIPKKVVEKPFDMTGVRYADMKPSEALKKLFGYSSYAKGGMANEKGDSVFLGSKYLPSMKGFVKMMKAVQSPFEGDNATYIPKRVHYDVRFFRDGGINAEEITKAEAYKTFLFDEYGIKFKDLPAKIQNALMIGNQQLIDNYINQ